MKDRRPKAPGAPRAHAKLRELLGITPYAHQSDALALLMRSLEDVQSFALLHDMGCGKTLTILGSLMVIHEDYRPGATCFVACPNSVMGAWGKEISDLNRRMDRTVIEFLELSQKAVKVRAKKLVECLAERRQRRSIGVHLPPLVVVTNYEGMRNFETELRAAKFDYVVADESQRIKSAGAAQSQVLYRVGRTALMRVCMSGTPVSEGPLGWYGQMRFMDARVFGTNYAEFSAKYARVIDCGDFTKEIVNPWMKEDLERKVMSRSHRVSKADAVDLPPASMTRHTVVLDSKSRKIYDALERDSVAKIEDMIRDGQPREVVAEHVLTRVLRKQQISGGFVQLDGDAAGSAVLIDPKVAPAKMRALKDLMEDLRDGGKKLVIFHRFTHEGLYIEDVCRKMIGKGADLSVINGSIDAALRPEMVRRFQEDEMPFIVCQVRAAGLGITLTAASDSAYYSVSHSSEDFEQSKARIDRITQKSPVNHHLFQADETVDVKIYDALEQKLDASIDTVDGGWARYLKGER